MIVKDIETATEIAEAYGELIERALLIVSDAPFYVCVEDNAVVTLTFEGTDAVLSWSYYASDYYGAGSIEQDETRFPAQILFITDDELLALRVKARAEQAEKDAKVKAAQEAVAKDRAEARDRAEWARLRAKYGVTPPPR